MGSASTLIFPLSSAMKKTPRIIGIAILMIVILILCEFVEIVSWQQITSSYVKKEVMEA
ncbi:hypothetical protein AIC95_002168 [Salmonella enterica subsp. enterica]|uniref:Uncharacterized protein n=1 Tax=Salmonella enterica TaxID=28901 RepID=A0A749TA82_SALER|nr:hypothetical protein [Salmonella enterica subsp. enterica serovar Havana]EDQ0650350.1 hypothetical protein [Salmonella enterica subsp. enterica serovar Oranienburg]EDQ5874013.1 hypothetical protein [Salmonella enterica subsp. enterica]EDZ3965829.1 hypothetical protein [Salmonella enterica]EED8514129.1 hypothetical protein [Salmonella enterica subsp. enterica serovar Fresno]